VCRGVRAVTRAQRVQQRTHRDTSIRVTTRIGAFIPSDDSDRVATIRVMTLSESRLG
jgi:hypothetical protein